MARTAPARTIVLFGDSTTARRGTVEPYSDMLEQSLPKDRIVNAGVGGNDTSHACDRFVSDVLSCVPDVVVIQFGINDASVDLFLDPPAIGPRVDLDDFETNLRFLIEELVQQSIRVFLMTPNPMRWTPFMHKHYAGPPYDHDSADGFNVILRDYAERVREVTQDTAADLIDVWAAYDACEDPGALLLDGVHPNDAGQRLVADLLLPHLKEIP